MKMGTIRRLVISYQDILLYLFLILSTTLVYSRITGNGFVNIDDPLQLTGQVHVLSGLTWKNLIWSFSPESWCAPLTWFTYTAVHAVFGLNPGVFHVLMLALHFTSSVLLFSLLKNMTGDVWKSAFVGALFALHPVNVESVAWVAELNNVLSGLFFMLTLLAYLFYTRKPDWKKYILVLLIFELGLLAKPAIMTLPFILLLLDLWPLKRLQIVKRIDNDKSWALRITGTPILNLIIEKIPLISLSFASLASNLLGANQRMGLYGAEFAPMGLRISNALVSIIKYLAKLFWPDNLAVFYPYPNMIPFWQIAGAVLVLVLVTTLALQTIWRHPYFLVGWLWFLGGLVPFLGIFQAGLWPELADRYAYLTYIGIYIALTWGCSELLGRWRYFKPAAALVCPVIILSLMALTWIQVGYWKDSETLFSHAREVTRDNFVAHNGLGLALSENDDIRGAIHEYRQAIKIKPYYFDARYNLGNALYTSGNYDEAAEEYRICLRINPHQSGYVYNNLGNVLFAQGNYDGAIKSYLEQVKTDPHQPGVYYNIGTAYARKGNVAWAIEYYEKAIRERPGYVEAMNDLEKARTAKKNLEGMVSKIQEELKTDPRNPVLLTSLGDLYSHLGEDDKAIAHYQGALSIQSGSTKAAYGLVLIHSQRQEYAKAVDILLEMKRSQPDNPEVYYNLACIYGKQGMPDESIKWLKQSIEKGFANRDLIMKDPDLEIIRSSDYVRSLMNEKNPASQ
jgi:protein O-mannosyl-transferase